MYFFFIAGDAQRYALSLLVIASRYTLKIGTRRRNLLMVLPALGRTFVRCVQYYSFFASSTVRQKN